MADRQMAETFKQTIDPQCTFQDYFHTLRYVSHLCSSSYHAILQEAITMTAAGAATSTGSCHRTRSLSADTEEGTFPDIRRTA